MLPTEIQRFTFCNIYKNLHMLFKVEVHIFSYCSWINLQNKVWKGSVLGWKYRNIVHFSTSVWCQYAKVLQKCSHRSRLRCQHDLTLSCVKFDIDRTNSVGWLKKNRFLRENQVWHKSGSITICQCVHKV